MSCQKTCFKCGVKKDIDDFYKHPQMGDGHLNKCKECTKKDVSKDRNLKIDAKRHYDRNRKNKQERNKEAIDRTRIRRKEDFRYQRAHNAVRIAIKKGILTRTNCSVCGREDNVHAHHDDYDHPLDVIFLCPVCHRKRHDYLASINKDVF